MSLLRVDWRCPSCGHKDEGWYEGEARICDTRCSSYDCRLVATQSDIVGVEEETERESIWKRRAAMNNGHYIFCRCMHPRTFTHDMWQGRVSYWDKEKYSKSNEYKCN